MPFIFGVVLFYEILQSGAHFEALSLEKAVKWLQLQGFCLWTSAIWDEVWSFLKIGSRKWGKLYEISCWSLFIFQISAFWKAPFCVLEFLTRLQTSLFFSFFCMSSFHATCHFFLGRAVQLAASWFPDQRLNPCRGSESAES